MYVERAGILLLGAPVRCGFCTAFRGMPRRWHMMTQRRGGTQAQFENSYAARIGRTVKPLVRTLGCD